MNQTDALIEYLAARGGKVAANKRLAFAMPLVSAALACLIALIVLQWPPLAGKLLIVKWAMTLPVTGFAIATLYMLSHPGRRSSLLLMLALAPMGVAGALGILELTGGLKGFPGPGWPRPLVALGLLGTVAFAAAIYAVRPFAPVRLRHAGCAAGLAGGGIAASAYAPFCTEPGALWLLVFYVLPIMGLAAFGWLAGPRLLRW
jgi:hypothetical protein